MSISIYKIVKRIFGKSEVFGNGKLLRFIGHDQEDSMVYVKFSKDICHKCHKGKGISLNKFLKLTSTLKKMIQNKFVYENNIICDCNKKDVIRCKLEIGMFSDDDIGKLCVVIDKYRVGWRIDSVADLMYEEIRQQLYWPVIWYCVMFEGEKLWVRGNECFEEVS